MKVESFRTQKEVIKAQYSAAEAQVRIGEAATGICEPDVRCRARGRARERQDAVDAGACRRDQRADRGGRARRTSPPPATTSTASSSRSPQSGQVDDELAKLKAELGAGEAPAGARGRRATSPPRPSSTAPPSRPRTSRQPAEPERRAGKLDAGSRRATARASHPSGGGTTRRSARRTGLPGG